MAELDKILEKYTNVETGTIHGASFVAINRDGDYIYRKAAGSRKANGSTSHPLTLDTVTWIASQTKLTTSVSVMQVVERGLVGLDDDVRQIVPLLRDIKVITGFEDGPLLENVQGPITLRQLMTHTSGFRYDVRHPLLIKYSEWAGRKENMFSGTIDGVLHPLIFQPGTSWDYGPGLDWAARVVETLTGMNFDEYQQEHIWTPLEAINTSFFPVKCGLEPEDIHESAERVGKTGVNEGMTKILKSGQSPWLFNCRDALGGAGLFSTANDYAKLLGALLAGGGPLLAPESVDLLFSPQDLDPDVTAALRTFVTGHGPEKSKAWLWDNAPNNQNWQEYMEIKHCLCGLVNTEDVPGRRRRNTVNWDGLPNLLWFIDRESGVAATVFTQIMPPDDAEVRKMCQELETALYKAMGIE